MIFSPVYLYLGSEVGEKNDTISKLQIAVEKQFNQIDRYIYYPSEDSVSKIVSVLGNQSLFSAARFVIIRNADEIKKKEDVQLLSEWIQTASKIGSQNDAFLVLTSDTNSIDKKLEKIIPKANKKIFWEMFENRKEQWIISWFKKNQLTIDSDAIQTILEMVDNNTEELRNECSRFPLCFEKDHCVTVEDVENVISHNREESAFTLFNALSDSDKMPAERLSISLSILQKIQQSKASNGIQLIAGLTYCFRKLRAWQNLHAEGRPSDFDLKINGFSSKKAQQQYLRASRIWNLTNTVALLALLSSSDMHIRSVGTSVENIVLQTMIYSIVIKKGIPIEV